MRSHMLLRSRRRTHSGFTLVEMAVVMAILTVAIAMLAQTLAAASRLEPIAEESTLAAEAARTQFERMRAVPTSELVARYDADPSNDPLGPGTAPGATFSVEGLAALSAAGVVGRIEFPTVVGVVSEESDDLELGMPRDLDGDGTVEAGDRASDWVILPVRIRLEWASQTGRGERRSIELFTMFARL